MGYINTGSTFIQKQTAFDDAIRHIETHNLTYCKKTITGRDGTTYQYLTVPDLDLILELVPKKQDGSNPEGSLKWWFGTRSGHLNSASFLADIDPKLAAVFG